VEPRLKKLLGAVFSPLSLAVGAAGCITFALSELWWVVPLTGVAWGALSATQYRGERATATSLRAPYGTRLHALRALMKRIETTLAAANDTVRACLADVPVTLADMSTKVEDLLARQSHIDAYLAEVHPQVANAELARLEHSLGTAQSDEARAKWAAAVENKRAEITARKQLGDASERIAAELAEMESALETTLSKIVALEHGKGSISSEVQAGITGDLSDLVLRVSALEQALEETATEIGAGKRA
jgi:chromosome segregation ATPase